jgi:hypothetical protein
VDAHEILVEAHEKSWWWAWRIQEALIVRPSIHSISEILPMHDQGMT